MATTQDYINQLKIDKQNLVSMLNDMGVEASNNETFTSLTPKVGKIVSDPILQDKSIEITENGTTNIVADEGYNGLNNVEVITNVAGSGGTQDKGLIIKEYDADGYPISVEVKDIAITTNASGLFGFSATVSSPQDNLCMLLRKLKKLAFKNVNFKKSIAYMCQNNYYVEEVSFENCTFSNTSVTTYVFNGCQYLKSINLPSTLPNLGNYFFSGCPNLENVNLDTVTTIGQGAFLNCTKLKLDKLPDGLTTLGNSAFANCSSVTVKTIPNGITALQTSTFQNTGMTQISMQNVTSVLGNLSANGCFYNSKQLKAVWIGSKLTTIGQYTFSGATSLVKIFIDLPRATVEAMSNYSVKWNATNATIICNDDADFMTKEEFDATTW